MLKRIEFELYDSVPVTRREYQRGGEDLIVANLDLLRAAGLNEADALEFHLADGLLLASAAEGGDGRPDSMTRTIRQEGSTLRHSIPSDGLRHLNIDPDAINGSARLATWIARDASLVGFSVLPNWQSTAEYTLYDVLPLRRQHGSVYVSIPHSLSVLDDAESIEYEPSGKYLLGRLLDERVDGRSHDMARTLRRSEGNTIRHTLPPKALAELDIDVDEVEGNGSERLALWTAPNSDRIAFSRPQTRTVAVNLEEE